MRKISLLILISFPLSFFSCSNSLDKEKLVNIYWFDEYDDDILLFKEEKVLDVIEQKNYDYYINKKLLIIKNFVSVYDITEGTTTYENDTLRIIKITKDYINYISDNKDSKLRKANNFDFLLGDWTGEIEEIPYDYYFSSNECEIIIDWEDEFEGEYQKTGENQINIDGMDYNFSFEDNYTQLNLESSQLNISLSRDN